jgi:hypothetical protein
VLTKRESNEYQIYIRWFDPPSIRTPELLQSSHYTSAVGFSDCETKHINKIVVPLLFPLTGDFTFIYIDD